MPLGKQNISFCLFISQQTVNSRAETGTHFCVTHRTENIDSLGIAGIK